eukprot:XP_025983923.1 uncharacterized protein LOC113001435 [Glycine max]
MVTFEEEQTHIYLNTHHLQVSIILHYNIYAQILPSSFSSGKEEFPPSPREEKPTESETSNPEIACPNDSKARKRKAKQSISRQDEKMEMLTVAAASVSINEQNPEGESSEADDDNGMQLLAAVATGDKTP